MRAPLEPSGCPRAMQPPWMLHRPSSTQRGRPRSPDKAPAWKKGCHDARVSAHTRPPEEPTDRPSPPRATGHTSGVGSEKPRRARRLTGGSSAARTFRPSHAAPGRNRPWISPTSGCGQVFGLVSTPAGAGFLLLVASQLPGGTSARDEVRSHLPLRGSPGFTPGSLLSPGQGPGTNMGRYVLSAFLDCQGTRTRREGRPLAVLSELTSHSELQTP